MAVGAKKIETRSWSTDYTGPIAIHAAKKWTRDLRDLTYDEPFATALRTEIVRFREQGLKTSLPLGAIIGFGHLVGCERTETILRNPKKYGYTDLEGEFGDFSEGRFGWIFEKMILLRDPLPTTGQMGLWNLDDSLVDTITKAHWVVGELTP
jgi:hypothetical protein